jgi:hypothetical protein
LAARYNEEVVEKSEQEQWEDDQLKMANQFSFGAKNAREVCTATDFSCNT